MRVTEAVYCVAEGQSSQDIRGLFCETSRADRSDENPLINTDFNVLLDKVVQEAFDAGRAYEQKKARA
jgi:hypothetical protein